MTEQKHTPTPWKCETSIDGTDNSGEEGFMQVVGASGDIVMDNETYYPQRVSPEDQERIVACVNACESMPDPVAEIARLRDAANHILAIQQRDHVTAERDRLREANAELLWGLRSLIGVLPIKRGMPSVPSSLLSPLEIQDMSARALLAKHSAHGQEKGG